MWILISAALMFSVLVLTSGTTDMVRRENDTNILQLRVEAGKLANFRKAADLYIGAYPTASGSIYWSTIKTAPNFPPALAGASIPSTWKIVANGSGQYTVCATTRDGVSKFFVDAVQLRSGVVSYIDASSGKTVITNDPYQVATEASKC